MDKVKYDKWHRMQYDPEYHDNHNKPWTVNDLAFLCGQYKSMKKLDLSLALGRTHRTILSKASQLRKEGQFKHFEEIYRRSTNGDK